MGNGQEASTNQAQTDPLETKMKRRFHLSNDRQLTISNRWQEAGHMKPRGFWYGVDLDWIRWLDSQDYFEDSHWLKPYLYEVEIAEGSILILQSEQDLSEFQRKYFNSKLFRIGCIDWIKVAKKYRGVEISPYSYSHRLAPDFMWYYGWDCASGVVWHSPAVTGLKLLTTTAKEVISFYQSDQIERERS